MESHPLFSDISPEQRAQMLCCFHPEYRNYQKGETVLAYAAEPTTLGILLSGAAHLYYLDADGGYTLLEQFAPNDLFGEIFLPPVGALSYLVEADAPCQVLFLPYADLIKRCENACEHHSQLVSNLLQMTAKKTQSLALHLNFVSKKTVRQRLLSYLEYLRDLTGAPTFYLEHSLSWVADYLCVDRTSLMREMRNLRQWGVIATHGKWVTLDAALLEAPNAAPAGLKAPSGE